MRPIESDLMPRSGGRLSSRFSCSLGRGFSNDLFGRLGAGLRSSIGDDLGGRLIGSQQAVELLILNGIGVDQLLELLGAGLGSGSSGFRRFHGGVIGGVIGQSGSKLLLQRCDLRLLTGQDSGKALDQRGHDRKKGGEEPRHWTGSRTGVTALELNS